MTVSTSIVKLEVATVYSALSSWMVVTPCLTIKPRPDWSLVTDRAISVHYEVLRFAVFLNKKLDLCFACFPKGFSIYLFLFFFLAGVS